MILIYLIFISVLLVLIRIFYMLNIYLYPQTKKLNKTKRLNAVNTIICLGSGGHTKEMLAILKEINPDRYQREYLIADTDITSQTKIEEIEKEFNKISKNYTTYKIKKISRCRHVHQSYLSSIYPTLYSFFECIPILYKTKPELILTNGPGTCVPICIVAFLFKCFFINRKCKIVFIESFCRVKSLSLSGKILLFISDFFVVQWPFLQSISKKIEYFGKLM